MMTANFGGGSWKSMRSFSLHVLTGRWFIVFASLLIMSVAGTTYIFGLFSSDIKSSLGYDQTTYNLLSFFRDLGSNVNIVSLLINEVMPPWVVLSIGAVMNFFAYFMIWLAITGRVAKPHLWQICLYICIGTNSQTFANTGALVACVKNFPERRAIISSIFNGFGVLSGAIITQLYHASYGSDYKSLILLVGWLPTVVSFVFLRTIRTSVKVVQQTNELKIFYNILYISLGLAGFLMLIIIVQNKVIFSTAEYGGSTAVVLFLLFAPLTVIIREELNLWKSKQKSPNDSLQFRVVTEIPHVIGVQPPMAQANLSPLPAKSPTSSNILDSCITHVFSLPDRGKDYTILQALFSVDMLVLFIATTCGAGGILAAVDNLSQIGNSLGYPTTATTTFVSLISIWNYLGRVVVGFLSEIFLANYKFTRPLMFTSVLLFSCVGHLLIAFGIANSLYVASVIIGFCFGALWALLFTIISEIFGLKYFNTLYNLGIVASPVGSYILNVRVTGQLYDKEALKQMAAQGLTRQAGDELTCIGVECYKMSFIIITGATLFGCVVSLILVLRTRRFYQGDKYKKFREQATTTEADMASATNGGVQFREETFDSTVTGLKTFGTTTSAATTMNHHQPTQY